MRTISWILFASLLALGCGKKEGGGDGEGGEASSAKNLKSAVEAANKAVPEGTKLAFKVYEEPKKARFSAVVPDGWTESEHMPGSFEPPKDSALGFMTRFRVGTNCDGACEPKDWAAVTEKVNLKQLRTGTVSKEEDLGGSGKLLIASKGTSKYVQVVKWGKKSKFYISCRANLSKDAHDLVAAVEAACRAITSHRF